MYSYDKRKWKKERRLKIHENRWSR
jgi:hypothetical protein